MADIELVKKAPCGDTEKADDMNKKTRAERVVFILWRRSSRGIKLSSESQPELALQHVVKQKPVGRRAFRRRAAFFFPPCLLLLCNVTDKAQ